MVRFTSLLLTIAATFIAFKSSAQYLPPPRNLQFDSLTLVATWEPPRSIVLDEHFEGVVFPPANWQDTTQGMGWFSTTNGSSTQLTIPPHTTYAVVNNDLPGAGNNGCCDHLVTPEMNLTQANAYTLSFNSFFRGWDAETATVEISTDGGNTWNLLLEVLPHFAWATLTVDLSAYSGPSGSQHVKIAFKANDNGNANATGWAIDDVVVMSEELEVNGYGIFLDGTIVAQGGVTTVTFSPSWFPVGIFSYFCIGAYYDSGYSVGVCADFPQYYLAPPRNLEAVASTSTTSAVAILTWEPPLNGDYAVSGMTSSANKFSTAVEMNGSTKQNTSGDNKTDLWDILMEFALPTNGNAGIETDGNFIYTTYWNGGGFSKLDLNGYFIEDFTIAGVNSIRDLAYHTGNHHFYGSNNTNMLYELDLANKILIDSVLSPGSSIRHISFNLNLDGGNGGFYVGDWSSLRSIKMDGSLIANASGYGLVNSYGSGYDPVNNKIWIFDTNGSGVDLHEFDANTLTATGNIHSATDLSLFAYGTAGGLAYTNLLVSGRYVMLGLVQQDFVFEYDMGPDPGGTGTPANLIGYNIYRDNEFLVNVPETEVHYWDFIQAPGTYCYTISAVYDLTDLGFPGQIGESQLEGPACIDNSLMIYLPFDENWTASQFDVNLWTVGSNWVMDGTNGNPAPAAKFNSQPQLTNYSSKLVSFYMGTIGGKAATPYCTWLDFDYLLDDISASGTEKLTIEIENGDTWTTLKEFSNTGDVNWTKEHLNITAFATDAAFRIRFNTNGVNSELINYWLIDNIKVYIEYGFPPPTNLSAVNTGNPQQNDIQVSWDMPAWENFTELIQDDSTWENTLAINPGYSSWLGNKFTSGAGLLRNADIMWLNNSNSTHNTIVLDVFDSNHMLLGSSEAFVPVPGNWQTVAIPELDVDGEFFIMVRFDGQSGITDYLGMDITAPSGRPNNGWFYDGTTWSQMNAFGYAECVFLLRATLSTQGNCESGDSEQKSYGQPTKSEYHPKRVNQKQLKSATATSGLTHYELYRREYRIPVPGQDSLLTEWTRIATVQSNNYLDQNLEFKCYQYYAQAMYNEGSSQQSNTDEACFLTGVVEPDAVGIKLYPNPAKDFLTIEIKSPVESITVFDNTGRIVAALNLKNKAGATLDVSGFSGGIYSLKFTTTKGESFYRKFVKM